MITKGVHRTWIVRPTSMRLSLSSKLRLIYKVPELRKGIFKSLNLFKPQTRAEALIDRAYTYVKLDKESSGEGSPIRRHIYHRGCDLKRTLYFASEGTQAVETATTLFQKAYATAGRIKNEGICQDLQTKSSDGIKKSREQYLSTRR